ncbi:MAG: putative ABC transporter permease [Muribaculaceae bacterium]|nr:putative ABC transporter permease [Muribaculaceae bacterium]
MKKENSFDYYTLLFFLVSFLGWVWEVCIYLVRERTFVNRGILIGPWLPVYGAGALFLALMFRGRKRSPFFVFFLSMGVCSALEYATGYFLEKMWGIQWWDYSGMFLNVDGYICLTSCLLFGAGGVFLVFVAIPLYTALYHKIPSKIRLALLAALLCCFVVDAAYCADFPNAGRGITYAE